MSSVSAILTQDTYGIPEPKDVFIFIYLYYDKMAISHGCVTADALSTSVVGIQLGPCISSCIIVWPSSSVYLLIADCSSLFGPLTYFFCMFSQPIFVSVVHLSVFLSCFCVCLLSLLAANWLCSSDSLLVDPLHLCTFCIGLLHPLFFFFFFFFLLQAQSRWGGEILISELLTTQADKSPDDP